MKPNDTDAIKHTRALRDTLASRLILAEDGCRLYDPDGKRHIEVELYNVPRPALASVQRVAYALGHPQDHVSATEEVFATCGKQGNAQTGEGACCHPDHLAKRPLYSSQRRAA